MTRLLLGVVLLVVSVTTALRAQPPIRPDGWVVLPVDDYRALRTRAYPPDRPPDRPPVAATVTRVAYDVAVAGSVAAGTALLTVDVLEDGWASVALPTGLHIREARLGSTPLALVDAPGAPGIRHILLPRAGRSLVTLDVVLPVSARAGVEQLSIPGIASGLVNVVLSLDRTDVDVIADGGLVVERRVEAGRLRVVTQAVPDQPLSLTWRRQRDAARDALPLKLRATVHQVVGLGDEIGQLTARIGIEVLQGRSPSLTVKLPPGILVNQVQGSLVADWEMRGSDLLVSWLDPLERPTTIVVTGEFKLPASGAIGVPLLQVTGAERETGGVAVEVLGAGEVTSREARGLDAADPSDLGDLLTGRVTPAIVAYTYRGSAGRARSLAVTVSRYMPESVLLATVDEARYRVLAAEDGKLLVEGRLLVRNNQRSFLAVTLPAGAMLWSAGIDGRPVRPGRAPGSVLLLPLRKRRAGEDAATFVAEIVYVAREAAWTSSGEARVVLPALDVPVSRTGVALHHSPRYRVSLVPGMFRTEPYQVSLAEQRAAARVESQGSSAARLDERDPAAKELRSLVDRFQRDSKGTRTAGVLPVAVSFPSTPHFLYFVNELTSEGTVPVVPVTFKRTEK